MTTNYDRAVGATDFAVAIVFDLIVRAGDYVCPRFFCLLSRRDLMSFSAGEVFSEEMAAFVASQVTVWLRKIMLNLSSM
jgi:hypothetical protein